MLLRNKGLVKSIKFKKHRYLGDPINATNLFSELKVDELCFLDIEATREHRCIDENFVRRVADESNIPFAVGGGISTLGHIRSLINNGAEKVIVSSQALKTPEFVKEATTEFGSSTVSVCMDIKKNLFGKYHLYLENGTQNTHHTPVAFAQLMERMGAGEIVVNSIDCDGCMNGYDIELLKKVSQAVTIPVVALGGAGCLEDFRIAVEEGNVSAVAAGSFFVYKGARHAFLIHYPTTTELNTLFANYYCSQR